MKSKCFPSPGYSTGIGSREDHAETAWIVKGASRRSNGQTPKTLGDFKSRRSRATTQCKIAKRREATFPPRHPPGTFIPLGFAPRHLFERAADVQRGRSPEVARGLAEVAQGQLSLADLCASHEHAADVLGQQSQQLVE